jgi:hypothetical protein
MSRLVLVAVLCLSAARLAEAQADVLTQHNDAGRSGANLQETQLNTSNVNNKTFGKLAFRLVDGNVYAQPLIVSQQRSPAALDRRTWRLSPPNTNSVYAFDAEDSNTGIDDGGAVAYGSLRVGDSRREH